MDGRLIHICEVCGRTEIMTLEEQISISNGIVMKFIQDHFLLQKKYCYHMSRRMDCHGV